MEKRKKKQIDAQLDFFEIKRAPLQTFLTPVRANTKLRDNARSRLRAQLVLFEILCDVFFEQVSV